MPLGEQDRKGGVKPPFFYTDLTGIDYPFKRLNVGDGQ